jgi:hypothetical protein
MSLLGTLLKAISIMLKTYFEFRFVNRSPETVSGVGGVGTHRA